MDLSSIFGLLGNLPALLGLIDNIAFIIICFFLGSFAVNGWKRYKNYAIKIIGSVSFGFVCLFGSIILGPYMPFKLPFITGAIPAFITALMLHIILLLLSGGVAAATKYVKTESYEELMEKFNNLVDEVKRLKSVLKRKSIVPAELTIKQLEKELNKALKNRGIKKFKVLSKKHDDEDLMNFNVKSGRSLYKASFDSFTGELMGFEQTNPTIKERIVSGAKFLSNNKRVLLGAILALIFVSFALSELDSAAINQFNQRLQFTVEGLQAAQTSGLFINYSIIDGSCLAVTDLLYAYTSGSLNSIDLYDNATPNIQSGLSTYSHESAYPLFYEYEGINYSLIALFNLQPEELMSALMGDNLLNMIMGSGSVDLCTTDYNGRPLSDYTTLCSANLDSDSLCDCIEMSELSDYCSIISNIITNSLISQGMSLITG